MALAGRGAILIWNGITPEGRDQFYEWHIREHIPERVSISGFLSGSRYIAATAETSPEFFTLYETVDSTVTTSPAYLARLNAPTDWTKRATSHFRNTFRALTEVLLSTGPGKGGALATVRFDGSPKGRAAFQKCLTNSTLQNTITTMPRITGLHFCATNDAASATKTAESRDRADISAAPSAAILIEGCDVAAVRNALARLDCDGPGTAIGVYIVEHTQTSLRTP
jgi:hypothetical protein